MSNLAVKTRDTPDGREAKSITATNDVEAAVKIFLHSLLLGNFAQNTLKVYAAFLKKFIHHLKQVGINDLRAISSSEVQSYQAKIMDSAWSVGTKQLALRQLKIFFRFLKARNFILIDPLAEMNLSRFKVQRRLPQVLTQGEIRRILDQPFTQKKWGLRDKAIWELLYSSGLRRLELLKLEINDVDLFGGLIHVRLGKGGKDRTVPLGKTAIAAIQKYLEEQRPRLEKSEKPSPLLFLSAMGMTISSTDLSRIVHRYAASATKKRVYTHLIRHTMATHLLINGAGMVVVQQMLGHLQLNTTMIYTHLDVTELRKIHSLFHPRGQWRWKSKNS